MTEHTSGPWELAWEDGKHGVIGATTEGKCIAIVGNNPDDGRNDERKANAQLIAAAPDLLKACKEALEYADLMPGGAHRTAFEGMLTAVIGKAAGGV